MLAGTVALCHADPSAWHALVAVHNHLYRVWLGLLGN
jgi:hypothetical protein